MTPSTRFALRCTSGAAALLLAAGCNSSSTPHETVTLPGVACEADADCAQLQVTACQQASCDRGTGRCAVAPQPDGTTCSTNNRCLAGEFCQAGTCGGGQPARVECGDRQCGADACGNPCGRCAPGEECTDAGRCEVPTDPCQGLTFEGCCTADHKTRWCDEDGELQELDCVASNSANSEVGPNCGWLPNQDYYYCTYGEELSDPSAGFVYSCPGTACPEDACGDRECGAVCGQDCGSCGDGQICSEGQCIADVCRDLSFIGCCDGTISVWCQDDAVQFQDCAGENPAGTCGWDGDNGWYDCDQTGADTSGDNPQDCSALDFDDPR